MTTTTAEVPKHLRTDPATLLQALAATWDEVDPRLASHLEPGFIAAAQRILDPAELCVSRKRIKHAWTNYADAYGAEQEFLRDDAGSYMNSRDLPNTDSAVAIMADTLAFERELAFAELLTFQVCP